MAFKSEKGQKFVTDVLPDTGCSQTIIAKDMVDTNNIVFDRSKKKKIKNASNEPMQCNGTVAFEVQFEGQKTMVQALVSSDLTDEILLGWRALQRLGIISPNFPHVMGNLKSADILKVEADSNNNSCGHTMAPHEFQSNLKEVNNRISHADSCGHTMAPHESHSNPTVNRISHAGSCGHTMAPHEPHSNPKVRVEKTMEDFPKISKPAGGHNTKLFPRKGGGDGDAQHVVDILSDPRDLVSDTKQVPDVDFILDPGGLNPNSKSYNSNSKSYGGCGGGLSQSCGTLKVRRRGNISNQKCRRRYRANRGRFRGTIKDNGARVPKEKPKLVEGHFVPVFYPNEERIHRTPLSKKIQLNVWDSKEIFFV